METLQNMKLFITVAQAGSFSAAGRAVGLSPASISRHINDIEQSLGVRLIHRTSRALALTDAGRVYLEKAIQICGLADELVDQVTEAQKSPRGLLHVHARVAVGTHFLAPVLPGFLRRYPAIVVKLVLNEEARDLVKNGIDVSIRLGNLDEPLLVCRRLTHGSERILFASPDYLRCHPEIRDPQDLLDHNCLTWPLDGRHEEGEGYWRFNGPSGARELRVSGTLHANNADVLRQAALAGLGVALLPIWCIADDLGSGRLVRVLPEFDATPTVFDHNIYAVYEKTRYLPPKIRVFIDYLANVLRRPFHHPPDVNAFDAAPVARQLEAAT